jgi:hypothetical protein
MHRMLARRVSPSPLRRRRAVVALALGFTAIPAVALAATDAVPGDPFKLGQDNPIAATTTLTGTGQGSDGALRVRKTAGTLGPAVKIENSAGGVSQPGLSIKTQPGQSPIQVNSDAGKANFLNADKLDGKDSKDFLPTRLYGVDTGPGLSMGSGGGTSKPISLRCDSGDIALNAGGNAHSEEDHLNNLTPFRDSYIIEFTDNDKASGFSANMICIDFSPFHQ